MMENQKKNLNAVIQHIQEQILTIQWDNYLVDQSVQKKLLHAIAGIRIQNIGKAIGVFWWIPKRKLTLSVLNRRECIQRSGKLEGEIVDIIENKAFNDNYFFRLDVDQGSFDLLLLPHKDNYCAIIFVSTESAFPNQFEPNLVSLANLLFFPIENRARLFGNLPAQISKHYWQNSLEHFYEKDPDNQIEHPLSPPWYTPSESVEVVSLSADLRLSTFCMDNACHFAEYTIWVNQLVQILMTIAHKWGGVFDKFTGDGALIHFLEKESQEIYGQPSVILGLSCAREIHYAVNQHVEQLRKGLHHDNKYLGVGIGLDVGVAHWSRSEYNSPVVVGDAVVGACRCADLSKPHNIITTNYFYHQALEHEEKMDFAFANCTKKCNYTSKEYLKGAGVKARKYKPQRFSSKETHDVQQMLEDIYQQSE